MLLFSPETLLIALWLGWWLDQRWAEPRCLHPLVGFGYLASWLERSLNPGLERNLASKHTPDNRPAPWRERLLGILALIILIGGVAFLLQPLVMPLLSASRLESMVNAHGVLLFIGAVVLNAAGLYLALGAKSLDQHLEQVESSLQAENLPEARRYVGWLVSRDTAQMDNTGVARACVESGLENGNDAVFAALFWFVLAGAPGVLLFRAVNTLDAMWGYKTPERLFFGWAAARTDDLLNLLPARLTALTYSLVVWPEQGVTVIRQSLACWWRQGRHWESPNAGPVMASGAGALGLQLGGGDWYHGRWKERPALGLGRLPVADDIRRVRQLLKRSAVLQLVLFSVVLVIGNV